MISFSILVPTYKRNKFLERALESICAQKASISEIIVIDDFGSEECELLVNKFNNTGFAKFIYKKNQSKRGEYFAKNWANQFVTGNYIAFLDDDDFWSENYLENSNENIIKHNPDIILSDYTNYYDKNKLEDGKKIPDQFKIEDFLVGNPGALQSNVIIKKSVFDEIEGFDTSIPCADKDLFVRTNLKKYKYLHIKTRNVYYQIHDGGYSLNYKKLIKSKFIFYMKYFKYYISNHKKHYQFIKFLIFLTTLLIKKSFLKR